MGAVLSRDHPRRRAGRTKARAGNEPGQAPSPPPRHPRPRPSGRASWPGKVRGDVTLLVAVAAGLIGCLSPCVLPLVPAYLGQLTAVAVAGSAVPARPSRWLAFRHAAAYVAGFGLVFTIRGITATLAGGPLAGYLPVVRAFGGGLLSLVGFK